MMRGASRIGLVLACLGLASVACAAAIDGDVLAQGRRDGDMPAWDITVASPPGWTRDCCTYAKAIGVDAVLYQGEWSGKPQRVMVLNVTPRNLPTLAAEVQADRKRLPAGRSGGKVSGFAVRHRGMPCQATVYQGTDGIDDVVVFCDPGAASGLRLSWSMGFDDRDPTRRALLDDFMRVVVATALSAAAGHADAWWLIDRARRAVRCQCHDPAPQAAAGGAVHAGPAGGRLVLRAPDGKPAARRARRRRCWRRRGRWRAAWW